ncbi:Rhodanese-like domain-containing protein 6 [Nymphaea thermarum]|nr:Rhodanese-like domain-containing protein 6 [Nymphaea thermarum]
MEELGGGGEEQGVLLYYRYVTIPDVPSMALFFRANCESLGLLGRVRISPSGVNVTVGGKMTSLKQHIAAVESYSLFEGTDFKLASCRRPSDDRVATECGFTTLSVRVVKELVTLCSHPLPRPLSISNAGEHLSAAEFHSVIQNAANDGFDAGTKDSKFYKGHVLLDARNIYETRIGKFQAADVDTLDPGIRQYSDLPAWIDAHSDKLQGNCILMYYFLGIPESLCHMGTPPSLPVPVRYRYRYAIGYAFGTALTVSGTVNVPEAYPTFFGHEKQKRKGFTRNPCLVSDLPLALTIPATKAAAAAANGALIDDGRGGERRAERRKQRRRQTVYFSSAPPLPSPPVTMATLKTGRIPIAGSNDRRCVCERERDRGFLCFFVSLFLLF